MNDQRYFTKEEHERYQQARLAWVLRLLFYFHFVAYVVTNGVFLILFGLSGCGGG